MVEISEQPNESRTLPKHVAKRVRAMIATGELALGDKLPPQRELSASFGVSRTVLREAISLLAASGTLRTEAGRGTYVQKTCAPVGQPDDVFPLREGRSYTKLDVCRFRHLVEGHSARLAAMRITDDEINQLVANLASFKEETRDGDFEASARTDLAFHHAIVAIAGVDLFTDLHRGMRDLLLGALTIPTASRYRGWEPVVEHERVLEALRLRDPDEARYYMQSHIVRSAERLGILLAGDIV